MTTRALPLLAVLLLAGCTSPGPAPDLPKPDPGPPVGKSTATLAVDGQDRTYRVYRPADLPTGAPLVIVLHGAAGTGQQAEDAYGWDAVADQKKFLVAYPDGVRRTWNVSPDCCGVAARDDVDDVGFLTRLATAFGDRVDPRRVYATGISNGALLSYRLACETDTFAAIGPVAGTMINPCPSPKPISIIHIHGTTDPTIPYQGGPGRRSNEGAEARLPAKIDGPAVPALLETWRKTDACPAPKETKSGAVTRSVAVCPGGRAVELITVTGAGHQWPGARPAPVAQRMLGLDAPSTALQATPTIADFFLAHPKG